MNETALSALAPVVSVGEALVDLIVAEDGTVAARIGGGPFNVARTVGRLGAPSVFLGRVSTDPFGVLIADELTRSAVRLAVTETSGRTTTMAIAGLDAQRSASYWFHLVDTSAFDVDAEMARHALSQPRSALHVGTLGLVVNPMADAVAEALAVSPTGGTAVVMLDPNCRPSAITDQAGYAQRIATVLARSDVVKVSTDDLEYLAPGRQPLDGARSLLDGGAKVVLITEGGRAVRVLTAEDTLTVEVPPVEVVDTIGAGDAFGGGFLTWWVGQGRTKDDLADIDAVRHAVVAACDVAAFTCTRVGADPPRAEELSQNPRWSWLSQSQ